MTSESQVEFKDAEFINAARPMIEFIEGKGGPKLPASLKILGDGSIHIVLGDNEGTTSHPNSLIVNAICFWIMEALDGYAVKNHTYWKMLTLINGTFRVVIFRAAGVSPIQVESPGRQEVLLKALTAICTALGYEGGGEIMAKYDQCLVCGDDRIGQSDITPELDWDDDKKKVEYYCELCNHTWEDFIND